MKQEKHDLLKEIEEKHGKDFGISSVIDLYKYLEEKGDSSLSKLLIGDDPAK